MSILSILAVAAGVVAVVAVVLGYVAVWCMAEAERLAAEAEGE